MHDKINSESELNSDLEEINGLSYPSQMILNPNEQVQGVIQGQLSISPFRGWSFECQKLLETNVAPLSGSVALRQLNPIHKKGS